MACATLLTHAPTPALLLTNLAHVERGAEAAVARVLLVGESEHGELLAAHRVEHLAHLVRGRG